MIELRLTPKDDLQEILNRYSDDQPIQLYLSAGIYHQKLRLTHQNLKVYGSQEGITRITNSDYSYKMHEDGLLYNTFRTWTLMLQGDGIELFDLEIENASGSGFAIGQAVALSINADRCKLTRCRLISHQDTLFLGPLPKDLCERYDHFLPASERQTRWMRTQFQACTIEGDVDFIFGSGTALFEECTIIAHKKGYISAPSTYHDFPYGFVFDRCKFISLSEHEDVYLARPWREHGAIHVLDCTFEGRFHPMRFDRWEKTHMRFYEYPYVSSMLSSPLKEEETGRIRSEMNVLLARPVIK